MENVTLVIENGKVSKLNILNLESFLQDDCFANNLEEYLFCIWFNIEGDVIGYNTPDISTPLIYNKKIKDGTYISFSSNVEDENNVGRMFGYWVKKDGIVREAEEASIILNTLTKEEKEKFLKTNQYGFQYYETGFPIDLNFNRIGDDTEDIKPIITLPFFMEVMDNNEEHPHLFDEINELINEKICSKTTDYLEFGPDQYDALLLLNHNEEVFDILRKYSLV